MTLHIYLHSGNLIEQDKLHMVCELWLMVHITTSFSIESSFIFSQQNTQENKANCFLMGEYLKAMKEVVFDFSVKWLYTDL